MAKRTTYQQPITPPHESFWLNAERDGFTAKCLARIVDMQNSTGAKAVGQMQREEADEGGPATRRSRVDMTTGRRHGD